MLHKQWIEDIQQVVIQARPFVQQEQQKRLARMQVATQKQAATVTKLSLAEYITNFQIDLPSGYTGPYSGNQLIIDDFLMDWHDKVESLKLYERASEIATAVEFMTDDLLDITELIKELDSEDEYFEQDVKKYCKECIDKVIVPIRDGWQTDVEVYTELLQIVQDFLGELGVSTLALKVGDKVNYDIVEPVESTQNVTTNPDEEETIMTIHLYPYVYGDDELPFVDGRAIVWRKG